MIGDAQATFVTLNDLLKLLSDVEVVSVSSAETSAPLAAGNVYLDLAHLDKRVCLATGETPPMGTKKH